MISRLVPAIPQPHQGVNLLIDTDAANEIDDLYAVALAIAAQDRFDIKGFVACHFAARSGPESIEESYQALMQLFASAGLTNRFPTTRGSHPMRYPGIPEKSERVDLIIEQAQRCSSDNPLWVVCLGAATNLASAILLVPEIAPRVRYLFHGRSESTWPLRTTQFNIYGDIIATKTLLETNVPLAWFDTGTALCVDMQTTRARLGHLTGMGSFLHEYRLRCGWFQEPDKGFFDIGDIAWLLDPSICVATEIDAPEMTRWMEFKQTTHFGRMLHIGKIDVERTWRLFFDRIDKWHRDSGALRSRSAR